MPFLPAVMKNSTRSSSDSILTCWSFAGAPLRRLRLGREPGGVVDGAAADRGVGRGRLARLVGRRVVRGIVDAGARRLDDHRRLDALDVVVAVRQRAELGGQHEIEIDAVVLRIAAGAVLDDDAVRLVLFVRLHAGRAGLGVQRVGERLQLVAVGEERLLDAADPLVEEGDDHVARRAAALDHLQELAEGDQLLELLFELGPGDLGAVGQHHDARIDGAADQPGLELALVADERFGAAALGAEERRLRDVDVAVVDERAHLAVEERQQQRADVRSVHVRVGHDDDPVVAELGDVEVLGADAGAERRDHRLDLVAAEHLVEAGLLDVQDLPLDREDRLEAPVAPLLRRAAGRLTLDDVDLAERRIAFLAVGQLARQGAAVERALAADEIAGLARRLARARGVDGLEDHALRDVRVLLEKRPELVVDDRLDDALDLGVAELRLGLPLELRARNLDADDGGEPLADVVAADRRVLQVLREVVLGRVGVDGARQRGAEPGEVRAALVGVDVVGERVERFRVPVVPLHRDLDVDAVLLAARVDRLLVDRRLVLVQILDEGDDAALVEELVRLAVALVVDRDRDAAVEEGQLAQARRQRVEAVFGGLEDLRVGLEGDLGAALLGRARDLEVARRHAALVGLLVDLAVAPDLELEHFREGVDHRHADAVETA